MTQNFESRANLVVVTGPPHTGKTDVARAIVAIQKEWRGYDANLVDVDAQTRSYAVKTGKELHTRNDYVAAELERASRNQTVVSSVIKLDADHSPLIVVDGLQDYGQAVALRDMYGNRFHTVLLHDSVENRLARAQRSVAKLGGIALPEFSLRFPTSTHALLRHENQLTTSDLNAEKTWEMSSYASLIGNDIEPYLPQMSAVEIAETALSNLRVAALQH